MRYHSFILSFFHSFILLLLIIGYASGQTAVSKKYSFSIIESEKDITLSPYLLGFNAVYANEPDSMWSDGKIAGYLKNVNTSVMRYPGGTVCSYYHWNKLSGEGWKDSWDPKNSTPSKSAESFMDLDEFISLSRKIGSTPLVGINMSSARRWNRHEDGIREALDLMKYCKEKKFRVKYWFLDNEPYQPDGNGGAKTVEEYAGLINMFAPKMKQYDPDIKIIVNWNSAFRNRREDYRKLLSLAGSDIDVIDVHWYWSWSKPTFEKWLEKTPIGPWAGESYLAEIAYFRQMVKDFGYPGIKLASLEWNVGPIREKQLSSHQCALIQSEMIMQFMLAGLDMATFWPLQGSGAAVSTRSFVRTLDRSPQPVYNIFQFFGKMQGNKLLNIKISEDQSNILTLGVADKNNGITRVCVLNKNREDLDVKLTGELNMNLTEAVTYVMAESGDTASLEKLDTVNPIGGTSFIAPGYSLSMLTYKK